MKIFAFFILALAARAHATPPFSRGARPLALGNGYTAVSGDAYSLFYNPAGLFDVGQQEFAVDYGRWYSQAAPAGSDFNGLYAMPWRYKDQRVPVALDLLVKKPPWRFPNDAQPGSCTGRRYSVSVTY